MDREKRMEIEKATLQQEKRKKRMEKVKEKAVIMEERMEKEKAALQQKRIEKVKEMAALKREKRMEMEKGAAMEKSLLEDEKGVSQIKKKILTDV